MGLADIDHENRQCPLAYSKRPVAQGIRPSEYALIELIVADVARNGIVLDHGQTVAPYPAPPGLVLIVGDKVVVIGNKELRLPNVPELGEPGKGTGTSKGR